MEAVPVGMKRRRCAVASKGRGFEEVVVDNRRLMVVQVIVRVQAEIVKGSYRKNEQVSQSQQEVQMELKRNPIQMFRYVKVEEVVV
jgi:hypothetical protein